MAAAAALRAAIPLSRAHAPLAQFALIPYGHAGQVSR